MSKHRFQEFREQARSRGQALRQNTELEELVIPNKPKKFPVSKRNSDLLNPYSSLVLSSE